MDIIEAAIALDAAVVDYESAEGSAPQAEARKNARRVLQIYSGVDVDNAKSLVETLEDISKNGNKKKFHDISILIIRILTVQGFVTGKSSDGYALSLIHI